MMCVRCHKRPATVFVSQSRDSKQIQGYCFVCARELGIQPVNDMMDNMMNSLKQQTGMSDEELKEATEQMAQMMGLSLPEEDSGDDLFTPGGAATCRWTGSVRSQAALWHHSRPICVCRDNVSNENWGASC